MFDEGLVEDEDVEEKRKDMLKKTINARTAVMARCCRRAMATGLVSALSATMFRRRYVVAEWVLRGEEEQRGQQRT